MDNDSSPSADEIHKLKKRRLHGACDTCSKRKIKCDSAAMPGNLCTNCRLSNATCTHDIPRQPKKKDMQQVYIQSLEERLDKMERLFQALHPEMDIESLISSPSNVGSTSKVYPDIKFGVGIASELKDEDPPKPEETPAEEAEDLAHVALAQHLSQLSMEAVNNRFFGPSSSFMFVKHAMTVKRAVTGTNDGKPLIEGIQFRRPVYWEIRPWELEFASVPEPPYVYPEEDLLQSLVSLYFSKANMLLPVLHQPTFLGSFASGQHIWDPSFGMTVLLVCAVASRYSHDPRVLNPGDNSGLSSGWKYFCQVPIHRSPLLYRATLYDIQYYCLAIVYLSGTSIPHAAWSILGLGIRYSLEMGAHRRKAKSQKPTPQDEALKRAFWCLVSMDRFMSSFLGRPCALQDEDFDVEYPIECDDEYWETEDPEQAFKQPLGKPCQITAFIVSLKLSEILAFALRTLYSTKKSKLLTGLIGPEWEHRVVAELDSSLNKWRDSLPHFLRWDPQVQDPVFFHQAVGLHSTFYYLQIQIHRPFLTRKSALTFPSHAMCTSAARSCSHVLDAGLSRGIIGFPNLYMAAFASGIVIMLNTWNNQRAGVTTDNAQDLENLQKCFNVIKHCEKRWHNAGRLGDMLKEIASLSDYKPTLEKRRREPFSKETDETVSQIQPSLSTPQVSVPWPPNTVMQDALSEPLPTHTFGAPFDTAANMPSNDWDLSNLLMVQMGYMHQQQLNNQDLRPAAANPAQPLQPAGMPESGMNNITPEVVDDRVSGMGYTLPGIFENLATLTLPQQQVNPNNPFTLDATSDSNLTGEVFPLWADLPNTFSAEEWESFLSNGIMGQF